MEIHATRAIARYCVHLTVFAIARTMARVLATTVGLDPIADSVQVQRCVMDMARARRLITRLLVGANWDGKEKRARIVSRVLFAVITELVTIRARVSVILVTLRTIVVNVILPIFAILMEIVIQPKMGRFVAALSVGAEIL